mgnify:CR=1
MSNVDESKIKACFLSAEFPGHCCIDNAAERKGCYYALNGRVKEECPFWDPARTKAICKDLLGFPDEFWGTIRF